MAMREPTKVAIASAIGNAVGMQAALRVIFALFLVPVSEDLGISRSEYLASAAVGPIATAVAAIWFGRLIDRVGPRRILIWGLVAFAGAEMALSLMTPSPLVMGGLWALFGMAAATQAPTAYIKAISGWFAENRGKALGLTLGVGAGIGAAVTTIALGAVLEGFGWRWAFFSMGVIAFVIGIPALVWGLKDPPYEATDATSVKLDGLSGAEARRTSTFWMILSAVLLHQLILSGLAAQQGAILLDLGISSTGVGLYIAVFGLCFAGGQAVLGVVMDRYDTPKVGIPFFTAGLFGVLIIHYVVIGGVSDSVPVLLLSALMFGFGSGAELALQGYYVGRYFGQRAAGELFSTLLVVFVVSGAIGSILFGATYDLTGSYHLALLVGEVLLMVGILLIALLRPYRYDVHGAVVEKNQSISQVIGEA